MRRSEGGVGLLTSTVSELTTVTIESNSYDAISTTVGALAILVLIVLLVARELIRAYAGPHADGRIAVLNVSIFPLLSVFAIVIVFRLLDLL
jgi:hypothetical protein